MSDKILFEITIPTVGTELVYATDVASAMQVAEELIVPADTSYGIEQVSPSRWSELNATLTGTVL